MRTYPFRKSGKPTSSNPGFQGFSEEVTENSRFLSEQEAYAYMDALIERNGDENKKHYVPYWKHRRLYIATKLLASVEEALPCIVYRGHTFIQQPKSNVL